MKVRIPKGLHKAIPLLFGGLDKLDKELNAVELGIQGIEKTIQLLRYVVCRGKLHIRGNPCVEGLHKTVVTVADDELTTVGEATIVLANRSVAWCEVFYLIRGDAHTTSEAKTITVCTRNMNGGCTYTVTTEGRYALRYDGNIYKHYLYVDWTVVFDLDAFTVSIYDAGGTLQCEKSKDPTGDITLHYVKEWVV